jgi:hypothetical protein
MVKKIAEEEAWKAKQEVARIAAGQPPAQPLEGQIPAVLEKCRGGVGQLVNLQERGLRFGRKLETEIDRQWRDLSDGGDGPQTSS